MLGIQRFMDLCPELRGISGCEAVGQRTLMTGWERYKRIQSLYSGGKRVE